jgi:branched-chain amino acid transport system ATP-binding protein
VTTPLLEAARVTKRFGAFVAVDSISFSIGEGEVLGIAGPNGSGKSTLFNLLTGLPYHANVGEIRFRGESIVGAQPARIARKGLVRTFQKDTEFRTLSARDNVLIGTYCRRDMDRADRKRAIDRALDRVEFDVKHRARVAGDLSTFDKKRLMIASALVGEPKLLLLDEPASGLTKPEIEQLRTLILGLNQSGMTIIVIEHVLTLLVAVASRLIVLNEGRVLSEGEPTTVVRDERVISAYLGGKAHHAAAA